MIKAIEAGVVVGVLASALAFLYPIDAQSVPEGLVRSVRLFLQDYRQYLLPGVAVLATGLSLVVGRKASNS